MAVVQEEAMEMLGGMEERVFNVPNNWKRKADDNTIQIHKKSKALLKTPVQILHEKFNDIEYLFVQEGPSHSPTFKVFATLKNETFEGTGCSKKEAKLHLATLALDRFGLGEKEKSDNRWLVGVVKNEEENKQEQSVQNLSQQKTEPFTEDVNFESCTGFAIPDPDRDRSLYAPPSFRSASTQQFSPRISPSPKMKMMRPSLVAGMLPNTHIMGPMLPPQAVVQGFSQLFSNRPTINVEKARSYPVMVLSEIFPDVQLIWVDGLGRGDRQFKVEAEVQGRRFFGEGRSKKIAKLNLAKTILLCMYDIHDFKDAEAAAKSPKAKSEETQLEKKFPLTQLKEIIGEDLTIEVVQQESDPDSEEKVFHATVVVKGVAYEAVGNKRNLAKIRAAKKALDSLRPKKEVTEPSEDGSLVKKEIDTSRHPTMVFYELYRDVKFTESETKGTSGLTEYHLEASVEGKTFQSKASSKKKAKLRLVLEAFEDLRGISTSDWTGVDVKEVLEDKQMSSNPAASHPIVLLLKLNPQTHFDVSEDYSCDTAAKYKAVAHVGEREFNGEGPNKKTAKTTAARTALQVLYGIDPDNYVEENRIDYFANNEPKHEVPVELCNKVTEAVLEQFVKVFQGETQCKVIAAFVLARYKGISPNPALEVVSIGTGTKCITGDQIDHKGQTLNDCHGEIIACRGFRQYLYDELLQAAQNNASTVFERRPNGRFALKSNIQVYLFVNTAPCGDGRVFTLQTQQQGAKNKTAGLLRTKIENGQGTIPVPENNVQTSDGILEGERLRTMSCSDKILRWNALGVQGALLSYFIDPIYLEGVIVGLHYNYEALCRALFKRAGKMMNCPEPYNLNKPGLGSPNNVDISRDTSKATSNSFNWFLRQRTVEAVNGTTGQTVVLAPSRLCKLNFFDKFMQVLKVSKLKLEPKTYHAAKEMATDYQKAKEEFFKVLEDTTCGKWVGKPYEHDMFGY